MSEQMNRRQVLAWSAAVAGSVGLPGPQPVLAAAGAGKPPAGKAPAFKLGLVTYNLAAKWDLPTLIKGCKESGVGAVEFRTTHRHGVEPSLSREQRSEVRKKCADGGLVILGLGTTCEFHATDPAVVGKNIDECRQFIDLARDLGAKGVKVRPNGLPKDVPVEKTLEQIGKALRTCGEAAADAGVEIWLEVHGGGTSHPPHIRSIMDVADHKAVGVCWNSNGSDVKDGSVKEHFELLRPKLMSCHINELTSGYPWRELFALMNATGYDRYTLIEAQGLESDKVADIVRFMRFYRALWEELARPA